MPLQVLHCWSYGQGRWRGHHWQWPRGSFCESFAHECLKRTYAYCMPPQVLHCWSYGQGRWRGHHWQWPRPRLHQCQHLNPCSGCPRCSAAMTPTCRQRPSALAEDVRHLRTGHNYALLSNPGTHHNPLSAGIAWERVVMARYQMPDVFCTLHLVNQLYNV